MADEGLLIPVGFTIEEAKAALKELERAARDAGGRIKDGTKPATEAVQSFGDKLKEVAREERGEGRIASFYVTEMTQIIPVTGLAKDAIGEFAQFLVGGAGLGAAIGLGVGAIKLMSTAWREWIADAQRSKDALADIQVGFQKLNDDARKARLSAAERQFDAALSPGSKSGDRYTQIKAELDAATKQQAVFERTLSTTAANTVEHKRAETALEAQLRLAQRLRDERDQIVNAAQAALDLAKEQAKHDNVYLGQSTGVTVSGAGAGPGTPSALQTQLEKDREAAKAALALVDETRGDIERRIEQSNRRVMELADTLSEEEVRTAMEAAQKSADMVDEIERNRIEHELAAEDSAAQHRIQTQQQVGEQLGTIVGKFAAGQATFGQVMAQVGQMVLRSVIQQAITQVTANAAVAGSEAATSQAGIPIVGPALALAAMGAMMSAVLGLLGSMPSAAGGWTIPKGLNPMVQAHGGEHIIPAKIAQRYEEGAPGGQGGGDTYQINAMVADRRSLDRFFQRRDVVRSQGRARRNRRSPR